MGDIADMMIEGILDEETGEYLGDFNKEIFGTESPGFPISLEHTKCPICEKKTKQGGLAQHMMDKHGT